MRKKTIWAGIAIAISLNASLVPAFAELEHTIEPCPTGQRRVRPFHRNAYYRADGTYVSAAEVRSCCRQISSADKFWAAKLKDGRPSDWSLKKETSKNWTEEEKERVFEALSELPQFLWSNSVKGIYRFAQSREESNPASQLHRNIALYDTAFDEKYRLARVLAHELAHDKYNDIPESESNDYNRAAGWRDSVQGRTIVWTARKTGYVEEDGEFSPEEDFANNIEYYMFNPKKLKATTPAAYDWINTHYGDKLKIKGK